MNLNFNLEDFIKDFSNNCSKAQIKTFKKNEIITSYIEKRNQLCILVSGSADLVRYDFDGNRTIVDHFVKNDIFGEIFYNITTNNELLVEAHEKSKILFFIYDNIYSKCKSNCKFHQTLVNSLPELILNKVTDLNTRLELLTKRSTRDKLLAYFTFLSTKNLSRTFELPLSLTDLADYLVVDRSAMMRELKLLKEDGILTKDGKIITLLSM